jgi:23S rRNA (adenine2503-C2)-methyltransferase
MTESNWQKIATELSAGPSKKQIWNLLRHFDIPDHDWLGDSHWLWQVASEYESSDRRAYKLKLLSPHYHDVCETVLLRPRESRFAVCLSTQIGCAVACRFCATGKMGLQRNLSTFEIIEQFLRAGWIARNRMSNPQTPPPLRNVVFMGMGEPLHNADAVEQAIGILSDPRWFGLSLRSITLSTAGVPAKMIQMAERFPRLRIALSLHSADPHKRRWLVPKAVGDLDVLRETIAEINALQNDTLWIEIALIEGLNDSIEDALQLIDFCSGLNVEINVIPYNDTSHAPKLITSNLRVEDRPLRAPSPDKVDAFIAKLRQAGIFVTHRKTLGESIQAACGQLISAVGTPGC